jgi:hypothetical protein
MTEPESVKAKSWPPSVASAETPPKRGSSTFIFQAPTSRSGANSDARKLTGSKRRATSRVGPSLRTSTVFSQASKAMTARKTAK